MHTISYRNADLHTHSQVLSSLVVIIHSLLYMYVWYVENVHFLFVSLSQCVLICTPGVPLTPSNVMKVVREVLSWWGDGYGDELAGTLFILASKQKEIKTFPSVKQKEEAISYWINNDPLASWRRLITCLDWIRQTQLADSIRPNAEPFTGNHQFYITAWYSLH